jgi:hypothetical protein
MSTIKDVAAELEQAGKFIAAQIEKARGYEADAKEKVEHALKRADDHWTSVAQRLSEARKLCFESKQNFDDFKKKYAPDLSRTTIYRLTSIGAGTLSIEEQRKTWREEKREKRAAAKESRTKMSGIDEAARKQVEGVIANLPSSWGTPEESADTSTLPDGVAFLEKPWHPAVRRTRIRCEWQAY